MSLLADFLANRISAAGVSHVIKAPSPLRRTAWAIILLCTAAAMAIMTYRVLKEYLNYPTVMRSKAITVDELEFPAVTVCGLSPIPKLFAKEAGLSYMEDMKAVLNSLPKYNTDEVEKTRCLKDPLCRWAWFDGKCHCFRNPCDTLFCYPDEDQSDDKCACSMLMCQWIGCASACTTIEDPSGDLWCVCRRDFVYPLATEPEYRTEGCSEDSREECDAMKPGQNSKEFLKSLDSLNTTHQIKDLLGKLKSSKTKDLRDVERFFNPAVTVMDDYGFPADSFILSCSYNVEDCWDLVTLYTPLYGKCYMFNYVGTEVIRKNKVRMVEQAGKNNGLQLFLRARSNDSLPLLTRQLGVRLIVHDPRSIPVTSEDGIDLRPGDMTSIDVQYTETNRLGPPWGRCAKDGETLGNYTGNPYRQNDCERECVNNEVYHRCNCYHPKFLPATTVPRRGKVCDTNASESEDHCFRDTMDDNDKGKIKCDCPPPCKEKSYDVSLSTSKLNDDFFRLVKKVKSLTVVNGTPSVTEGDFESSLIGVQVYYHSLFVISVNETAIYSVSVLSDVYGNNPDFMCNLNVQFESACYTPRYTWESLIANIGGNMGLFLGLSIVTILEIAEFLMDTIIAAVCKRRRTKKVSSGVYAS